MWRLSFVFPFLIMVTTNLLIVKTKNDDAYFVSCVPIVPTFSFQIEAP